MENIKTKESEPNPLDVATFLSALFFMWPEKLIQYGSKHTIEQDDLPTVSNFDDSYYLSKNFNDNWQQELKNSQPSIARAAFKTFAGSNWYVGAILIVESGVRIFQANVLGWLIGYFMDNQHSTYPLLNNGYFLSFLLSITGAFVVFAHHHAFFGAWRLGLRLRVCLTSAIYEKAISLHLRSLGATAIGQIVNLSSQDVESFQQAGVYIHFIYQPIVEAIAIIYFGIAEIGVSFLAGFSFVLLLIPLQFLFSKWLISSRQATSKFTDERLKLVNQSLSGARLMKINGWENTFSDFIHAVRTKEIGALTKTNYLRGLNEAIFFVAPIVVACLSFITYTQLGGVLSPQKVFIVLTYFNITQFSLTKFFAYSVQFVSEASVGVQRIEKLLSLEVIEPTTTSTKITQTIDSTDSVSPSSTDPISFDTTSSLSSSSSSSSSLNSSSVKVRMENFSASWIDDQLTSYVSSSDGNQVHSNSNVLTNINFELYDGELVVIIGPVGSSKSSLLMALLGELKPHTGMVKIDLMNSSTSLDKDHSNNPQTQTRGRIAYVAQEPWIMSSTIKKNIVNLGRDSQAVDSSRYSQAVFSSALNRDLEQLPHGDETVIGNKGINLSGGQRARVGLARALYVSHADLYVFDDPLSAVDSHVSKHLFEHAICGELVKGKTRVLVTHQVQFISSPHVSRIIVMDNGKISAIGTYSQLLSEGKLANLAPPRTESSSEPESISNSLPPPSLTDENIDPAGSIITQSISTPESIESQLPESNYSVKFEDPIEEEGKEMAEVKKSSEIHEPIHTEEIQVTHIMIPESEDLNPVPSLSLSTTEKDVPSSLSDNKESVATSLTSTAVAEGITVMEERDSGSVKFEVYLQYAKSMGGILPSVLLMILMFAGQILAIMTNIWLAKWCNLSAVQQKDKYYLHTYIALVVVAVVVAVLRSVTAFLAFINASNVLHNSMLRAVLRAPVLFFDSNPIGRILNRFAKDVSLTDDLLPMTLFDCLVCLLMCIGSILVVCVASPFIFIALAPLIYGFFILRQYFVKTSREVKRLDSISRSPIFQHLSETLDGLVTLRAFDRVSDFVETNKHLLNENTRAYFTFVAVSRWLGFRLDSGSLLLLIAASFGSVAAKETKASMNPYLLAVGLMYILLLAGLFQWAVRQTAEVEAQLVSVERICAFSRLPSEPALHGPVEVPPEWPTQGNIIVKDVTARYREGLPPVLSNLSFEIKPGSRVGVVGRTGAGKSTLVSALLRLVDLTEGSIVLDGEDISQIGLHDLRPRISVVPQVPFIFSGTIRQNLDPWNKYSDEEVWAALECVHMKQAIERLGDITGGHRESSDPSALSSGLGLGLLSPVSENGNNFSIGERQLLCLARAVLQQHRVLVMDEATANIDLETDHRIQEVIRKSFRGSTVIMIAHRLLTVADCDQILVLSGGKLCEDGHPYDLLSTFLVDPEEITNSSTHTLRDSPPPRDSFASLVLDTGVDMSRHIMNISKQTKFSSC